MRDIRDPNEGKVLPKDGVAKESDLDIEGFDELRELVPEAKFDDGVSSTHQIEIRRPVRSPLSLMLQHP